MNYTLMTLHSHDDEYILEMIKSTNLYGICLFEKKSLKTWSKAYTSIDSALKAFNRGAEVIAKGEGSFDYKCLRIANTPAK